MAKYRGYYRKQFWQRNIKKYLNRRFRNEKIVCKNISKNIDCWEKTAAAWQQRKTVRSDDKVPLC